MCAVYVHMRMFVLVYIRQSYQISKDFDIFSLEKKMFKFAKSIIAKD